MKDIQSCPVCASDSARPCFNGVKVNGFEIVRCGSCGLVYANPVPAVKELEDFYLKKYFIGGPDTAGYKDYRGLPEINAKRMWGALKRYAGKFLPDKGRVLDVGCATGAFLAEASSDGWEGVGIEMSGYAAEIAGREFGLKVYNSTFIPEELNKERFNLITMWHILEHLRDPVNMLRGAGDLMTPGSILFAELPNWNSIGRMIRGMLWSQLKPPEHIIFFTPKTLARVFGSAGFKVLRCTTEYPGIFDKAKVHRFSRPLYLLLAFFAFIACRAGMGGYIRILARKS